MAKGKAGPRPGPVVKKPKGNLPHNRPAKTEEPQTDLIAAAPPPPKGHNSKLKPQPTKLTDAQEQALFLNHLAKVTRLKEIADRAISDVRNALKLAKAEGGFEKVEFDAAIAIRNRGAKPLEERIKREIRVAAMVGEPLQMELFGGPPDRTPAVDQAYEKGRIAGMEGADPTPPASVAQHGAWMEGYHEGKGTREQILRMPTEPAIKAAAAAAPIPDSEFESTATAGNA